MGVYLAKKCWRIQKNDATEKQAERRTHAAEKGGRTYPRFRKTVQQQQRGKKPNKLFADLATVLTALQHRTAFPVVNVETFFGELFVTLATEYAQAARQSSFNNIQGRFARRPWRPMQRRAFPLRHWIRRELDSIKLEYDPRRPDDRLILTASTFNWLQPWRQQSWSQGICRTRRFFPSSGRNHRQYSLHLPT